MKDTAAILEAYFAAVDLGGTPDLRTLCGADVEIQTRVEEMIARTERLCSVAVPRPALPRELSEFEILERIGAGGMGEVYRAFQPSLRREVALKVLRPERIDDLARKRFVREAALTAGLDHPNIVPIYAAGQDSGVDFLAMKLIRGPSLDRETKPMDPGRAAELAAQVASALHAAHEVGILHRDVKPANILLDQGRPVVVDFGLARDAASQSSLTQPNATPGTLAYMAPELLQDASPVFDPRIDVYSLGASLYELLSGRTPFPVDNPVQTMRHVLFRDPPTLGLRGRHRDLETIALRAMEKDAKHRFVSARAMAEELQRYAAGLPIVSHRLPFLGRVWRRALRQPAMTTLAVVAGGLLLVLGAVLQWTASADAGRREAGERNVRALLRGNSLHDARSRLREMAVEFPSHASWPGLRTQIDTAIRVRRLIVSLQSFGLRSQLPAMRSLTGEIRHATADRVASPRAELALHFAAVSTANTLPESLPESLQKVFPRTGSALGRFHALGGAERDAKGGWDEPGDPTDHLFAALVLRMSGQPHADVLRELALAPGEGPDQSAVHLAISASYEGLSKYEAAYLELAPVFSDPFHAALGHLARARLAGKLKRPTVARQHLRAAESLVEDNLAAPEHVMFLLAQLQVARDLDADGAEFWQLWRRDQERLKDNDHYWLLACYQALDEGLAHRRGKKARLEHLGRAASFGRRGLRLGRETPRAHRLHSALQQIDWVKSPYCGDPAPFSGDPEERARLRQLVAEAREFAAVSIARGRRLVAAEALLTAARAARVCGDRVVAWQLLGRACTEFGEHEALGSYTFLVSYRVLLHELVGPDADADLPAAGSLEVAATLALDRARTLLRTSAEGTPVEDVWVATAENAVMACAYYLGDPATCLESAHRLLPDLGGAMRRLAETVIRQGGLRNPVWGESAGAGAEAGEGAEQGGGRSSANESAGRARLAAAIRSVRLRVREGLLRRDFARQAVSRWLASDAVVARRQDPGWSASLRAVEALSVELR